MPSFPLALSHLVLNERLKCHLQESSNASNGELRDSSLHKALNDFVRINYKVLNREQYVRMMAIGGRILSKVNLYVTFLVLYCSIRHLFHFTFIS